MVIYILAAICGVAIIAFDQITKAYIAAEFALAESRTFIPGLIDLTYVHNKGGAWGMMSGHTWLLISLTVIIMIVCLAMLLSRGVKNKMFFWSVVFILSGGIGNLIDRIFRGGTVVDFLHLHFMPDFPVFNIADCAIVIGAGLLILNLVIDIFAERKAKFSVLKKDSSSDEQN